MTRRIVFCATAFLCHSAPILLAADTVEEVERFVIEKWADVKSMSANMTMTIHGPGTTPLKSTGTILLLNDGKVERKRMTMAFDTGESSQLGPIEQTVIYDGEFAWTVRKAQDGRQIVAKQRPDAMEGTPGGKDTFKQLRESFELKRLPDQVIEGKDSFVIESTPKQPAGRGIARYNFAFAKDSGILFKTVRFNKEGDEVNEIHFTDVKLNSELDPTLFIPKFDPETQEIGRASCRERV